MILCRLRIYSVDGLESVIRLGNISLEPHLFTIAMYFTTEKRTELLCDELRNIGIQFALYVWFSIIR